MGNSIEISGFDEMEDLLQDMTISEADEKKAMRLALEPVYKEVDRNAPVGETGGLRDKITKRVTREDLATVGTIKMGAFYTMFQEWGTSTQRHHVGFFERSIDKSKADALGILTKELLGR